MAAPSASSTFVTGVDAGGAASPGSSPKARRSESSPSAHHAVRRLEDESFQFVHGSAPQQLPVLVSYRVVVDDVLDTVVDVEHRQSQRIWQSNVPSVEFDAIVADLYWYCFLEVFRKPSGRKLHRPTKAEAAEQARNEHAKSQLLDRISQSYGNLFYRVVISTPLASTATKNHNSNNSKSDGDIFFGGISNAVAHAVYLSFYHAYPRSRLQINSAKVKDQIIDLCGMRLDGVRPSIAKHDHWLNSQDQSQIRKSAMGSEMDRGGSGMELRSSSREQRAAMRGAANTLGNIGKGRKGPSMPTKPKVRLLKRRTRLGHTPMMRSYLPLVSRWEINIGLTQDPKNRPLEDPLEAKLAKLGIVSKPDDGPFAVDAKSTNMQDEQKEEHDGEKNPGEGKARDEDYQPTAEEVYQEEQKEALEARIDNEPVITYQDVVTETRKMARKILKSHRAKRSAMSSDIAAGRRQVRKEQKSIDEQCREIQGSDAHEYSNYIVSKMDLQGNLNRKK